MTRSIACLEENRMRHNNEDLVDDWMMQSPQVYSHIVDMAKMRLGSLTTDVANDDTPACTSLPMSIRPHGIRDQSAITPSRLLHQSAFVQPHRDVGRRVHTSTLDMEEDMFYGSPPGLPTPANAMRSPPAQHHQQQQFGVAEARSPPSMSTTTSPPTTSPPTTMTPEEWAILADLSEALAAPSSHRLPPPNYVCHCCYATGHYIRDCPRRRAQESSGVYQGTRQSVGKFKCDACRHEWTSKKCYALCVQKCRKCNGANMPKKMYSMGKALEMGLISLDDMDME